MPQPNFYFAQEDHLLQGSPELFEQLTGASWTDTILVVDPASLKQIIPNTEETALMDHLLPLYREYLQNPPQLLVKQSRFERQHTLHSLNKIEKGKVVLEYLGEWVDRSLRSSSYRWGPIDALHHRNCAALVEDGFPNLQAFYLYGVDGIPLRILFVSLKTIEPGEMFLINYGRSHSVKTSYHEEYDLDSLYSFITERDLGERFQQALSSSRKQRSSMDWQECLSFEADVTRLQYLYQTPSALRSLIGNQKVHVNELSKHYSKIDYRFYLLGLGPSSCALEREIAHILGL